MPQWIAPLLILIGLVGFVVFAFRQGMQVKPDPNNRNDGPPGAGLDMFN